MIGYLLAAELFFLCISSSCGKKIDYCKFNCEAGKNSVCGNKCEPSSNTIKEITPDFTFRKRVLHYHNYYRDLLAGGKNTSGGNGESSNMMALSYDMNLEFSVACWVFRTTKMDHDKCRGSPNFERVGQNLYYGNKADVITEEGVKRFIEMWFEELVYVLGEWMDKFPGVAKGLEYSKKEIGHYTQLVWATTTHVGCAACQKKDQKHTKYMIGCNYGPAGNQIGVPVYLRGKPTTACPAGSTANKDYPNLCGSVVMPSEAKTSGIAELKELRGGAASMNKIGLKYKDTVFAGLLFIVLFLNHSF